MVKSKALLKTVKALAGKHGATALTIFAALGVVATAVLTAKAKPQADERVQRAKEDKALRIAEEKHENPDFDNVTLTATEKFKAAFPAYIKVIVVAGVTIGFIIGSRVISIRQVGDLAAAYNIMATAEAQTSKYAEKYEAKVREIIGDEKSEEVKTEVRKELNDDTHARLAGQEPDWIEGQIARAIHTGEGNTLIYDDFLGRFFYSSTEALIGAMNQVNFDATNEAYGIKALNDFYDRASLPEPPAGDNLFWDITGRDGLIELKFDAPRELLDGRYPYVIMKFSREPRGLAKDKESVWR